MVPASHVDLAWIPLGADGSPLVRLSGRAYEHLHARREHRPAAPLVHAALVGSLDGERFAVEMTPVWGNGLGDPADRGVVREGPVGLRPLGRSRFFRYEVRRWYDGTVPDLPHAVAVRRVATGRARTATLLAAVADVPDLVWGRDELRCGDMWTSNSLVSFLLLRAGVDVVELRPPAGGRAPGWRAGVAAAVRRPDAYDPPALPRATGR